MACLPSMGHYERQVPGGEGGWAPLSYHVASGGRGNTVAGGSWAPGKAGRLALPGYHKVVREGGPERQWHPLLSRWLQIPTVQKGSGGGEAVMCCPSPTPPMAGGWVRGNAAPRNWLGGSQAPGREGGLAGEKPATEQVASGPGGAIPTAHQIDGGEAATQCPTGDCWTLGGAAVLALASIYYDILQTEGGA